MLPDRVSNPRPLTYESGALPTALRGPATDSADPNQTAPMKQSDQGLHCLPFHLHLLNTFLHCKVKLFDFYRQL